MSDTLTKLAISKGKISIMLLFYVSSFCKKGDTIQGGTLFKKIRYSKIVKNKDMHFFMENLKKNRKRTKKFDPR